MELLYITDVSQLKYLTEKKPLAFERTIPITGDLVVAYELEKRNITFIDEWDFLKPDDIEKNWETANTLVHKWWQEMNIDDVEYEGFSLFDAASQDLVYPFEACLNAITTYERIIKEKQITKISGFFLPQIGVIRTGPLPTHRAVRSVAQSILFWIADKNKIPIVRLESGIPLSKGILEKGKPHAWEINRPELQSANGNKEKLGIVVIDGMTVEELFSVREAFKKLPHYELISISNGDLKQFSLGRKQKSDINESLNFAWNYFIEAVENYNGSYPEIFANTYLNFQFKRIWEEMKTATDLGDVFLTFLDILEPAVIIFGHEAFTIDRVRVQLAQKRKIPTISLIHGGMGFKFGYRGLVGTSDFILTWNDFDLYALKSYGVNSARLSKIGCIRYEDKIEGFKQNISTVRQITKRRIERKYGITPNKKNILLITAAINSGFSGPVANPRKHREAFKEIVKLASLRKDFQFLIKAHPSYDYYELYNKLHLEDSSNIIFLDKASLDDAIAVSDVCLMINYLTTAAIEVALNRVPIVFFDNAVYPLKDWETSDVDIYISRANAIQDLEKKIDSLLVNGDGATQDALEKAENLIFQVLDIEEISATDRLFYFLKKKIDNNEENIRHRLKILQVFNEIKLAKNTKYYSGNKALKNLYQKNSLEDILFVFAFFAGINKMGISSVYRLIKVQLAENNLDRKPENYWYFLNTYIIGSNRNSIRDNRSSALFLISTLFMHPEMFIKMLKDSPKELTKYFIRIIDSSGSLVLLINKLRYKMRNVIR